MHVHVAARELERRPAVDLHQAAELRSRDRSLPTERPQAGPDGRREREVPAQHHHGDPVRDDRVVAHLVARGQQLEVLARRDPADDHDACRQQARDRIERQLRVPGEPVGQDDAQRAARAPSRPAPGGPRCRPPHRRRWRARPRRRRPCRRGPTRTPRAPPSPRGSRPTDDISAADVVPRSGVSGKPRRMPSTSAGEKLSNEANRIAPAGSRPSSDARQAATTSAAASAGSSSSLWPTAILSTGFPLARRIPPRRGSYAGRAGVSPDRAGTGGGRRPSGPRARRRRSRPRTSRPRRPGR